MAHVHFVLILLILVESSFAAIDNTGTEFVICYMDNYITPNSSDYDVELFITTSSNNEAFINVTTPLYDPSWMNQTSVTRGNVASVQITADIRGEGTSKANLGVYITATEDVTVYSVNKQLYSTDAFTGYPTDSLGTEYVAVTWQNLAQIMVVAVNDATTVDFHFPGTFIANDVIYLGVPYNGNSTLTITLNRFETFHILSWTGDLTGTRINASSEIAAFSGGYKVAVEDGELTEQTSDHLVEQLMPTQAWGKEFISFPSPERTLGDYLRVTAAEDGTNYTISGVTYSLNAYEFETHNINSDTYYYIQSDKGISVMLFSKSIGVTGWNDGGPNGGDPAMSVVVPLPLYGYDYTWSTVQTTEGQFESNFIIVVTRQEYKSGLVLDDAPIDSGIMWTNVTSNSDYAGARIAVSDGSHSIYNTDPTATFFGIAYGNAQFNSYAYASGLRLASINLPCINTSTVAGDGEDNDCDGWIDEETNNGIDDDGDGQIDEDLAAEARVNGNWSEWSAWGSCSTTCGNLTGTYSRSRTCDNPAPANNGLYCFGNASETGSCTGPSDACPVCFNSSTVAGDGEDNDCDGLTDEENNNGIDDDGDGLVDEDLTGNSTDGNWSAWSSWTSCSVTCGSGTQSRNRSCDDPPPQNGGLNCTGGSEESTSCTPSDYCLPSYYGNVLLGCANTSFGCGTGTVQCIDLVYRCDGTADCEDGSDENSYFTGCAEAACQGRGGGELMTASLLPILLVVLGGMYVTMN